MQNPIQHITDYNPPPDIYQRAVAYSSAHYVHLVVAVLYGIGAMLLVLHWRVGPRYRDWAERASPRRFVQAMIFAPLMILTVAFATLPMDAWDQSVEQRFGRSVESWGAWATDWLTTQISLVIVGTFVVWGLYALIRRSPRRWWFYCSLASLPLLFAAFTVEPLVFDPLFFKFTPLASEHPDLVARIEQVVEHGGMHIPPERVFEMNASAKTTELNAYVAGFGASARAVVNDNTITKATPDEMLVVFGHEMGHYVLHHPAIEIVNGCLILLVVFFLGARLATWMLARWGTRWGLRGLDDWASFPLLYLLFTVLGFLVATPLFNAQSRHFEHEADRFGLEVVHGIVPDAGQVFARYFEKSGEINLSDPNPGLFAKIWVFDHPTRPERIHFVTTYDPWSHGESPRYVK